MEGPPQRKLSTVKPLHAQAEKIWAGKSKGCQTGSMKETSLKGNCQKHPKNAHLKGRCQTTRRRKTPCPLHASWSWPFRRDALPCAVVKTTCSSRGYGENKSGPLFPCTCRESPTSLPTGWWLCPSLRCTMVKTPSAVVLVLFA